MKKEKFISICNLVCAVLLLVALVLQFQPYWTCSDCKTHKDVDKQVSIAEYLWLPTYHEPIADEMTDLYREVYGPDYKDPATGRKFSFKVNSILPAMITVFLGSIAGIMACVFFHKKFFVAGLPLIAGIGGMLGHLTYPALQVIQSSQIHLIVFIVISVVALIPLIPGSIWAIQDAVARKKAKAEAEN